MVYILCLLTKEGLIAGKNLKRVRHDIDMSLNFFTEICVFLSQLQRVGEMKGDLVSFNFVSLAANIIPMPVYQ